MGRTFALLGFALLAWGLCGATIAVARSSMPMDAALLVHAAAAPIITFSLAYISARHLAVTTPLVTASTFAGVVILMDAGLVAPFLEKSWAMFRSPIGTWVPFVLIFLAAWTAAQWVMGPGPGWGWHATRAERRRPLPGDTLLADAKGAETHGITIGSSPERLWPWLLQMGCDRAGWYSWDRLDNGGRPSAERIIPELQDVKVGDVFPSRPGRRDAFEVLELQAPEHLTLGAHISFPAAKGLRWTAPTPPWFMRATWTFLLEPAAAGGTRLLVHSRSVIRPAWLKVLMSAFFGPAHLIMQRKQLLNLKSRAEQSPPPP